MSRVCTSTGTGYTVNDAPAISGSATGTASAAWVNYPSTCTWTANGAGGSSTFRETMVTNAAPATTPTMSVSRNPATMTAGQAYSLTWSSTNATSVSRVCTSTGSGYTVNDAPAINGSAAGTASAAWVNYPSTCTWTANGAGGSGTFRETMITNAAPATAVVTYIHTDGLGSPVARTDAVGAVISRTRYEPYGLTAGGATPTIGFTGHVNDADTGLVYMQQRYYDPVAGRFLSIDPVVTDANSGSSFSRYSYASNSPYKYIDPDGRQSLSGNMPYWSPMTQLEIGTRAWYGNLNQQTSTVTVATASAVTIGVGGSVVGEAVVTRVAGNTAIKNAADVVTIIRAVTKFFSEDSAVAPVAPPNPPAITQAATNPINAVKKQIETNTGSKDPKITPPPKEPPKLVDPPTNN